MLSLRLEPDFDLFKRSIFGSLFPGPGENAGGKHDLGPDPGKKAHF